MMLHNKKSALSMLIIATLIVGLGVYFYPKNGSTGSTSSTEANEELALVRPAFASTTNIMSTTLDNEAGMSMWLNATAYAPLNLNAAKSVMQGNVENATSDYVVGSIPLQSVGFTSDDNPHCFVHVSGWIVVYYLKVNIQTDPSTTGWLGKMFPLYKDNNHVWYDKDTNQLNDNLLHYALVVVCQGLSVNPSILSSAHYYHFQNPSATTLEMGVKTAPTSGSNANFNIYVPSSFNIDEQSWSFYTNGIGDFKVGATQIFSGAGRAYGDIPSNPNPLNPDVWYEVYVEDVRGNYATVAIVLLYH